MERAVTDYILRAYLDELSRLLSGCLWAWRKGLDKLRQLQKEVDVLKGQGSLTVAEVEPVSDQVHSNVGCLFVFGELAVHVFLGVFM